jgi:hypothetical protein
MSVLKALEMLPAVEHIDARQPCPDGGTCTRITQCMCTDFAGGGTDNSDWCAG